MAAAQAQASSQGGYRTLTVHLLGEKVSGPPGWTRLCRGRAAPVQLWTDLGDVSAVEQGLNLLFWLTVWSLPVPAASHSKKSGCHAMAQ